MTTTTTTTTTLLENNNNFNEQQDKIFVLHNTMYFQVKQNQHFHVMIFSAVGEGGKTIFFMLLLLKSIEEYIYSGELSTI